MPDLGRGNDDAVKRVADPPAQASAWPSRSTAPGRTKESPRACSSSLGVTRGRPCRLGLTAPCASPRCACHGDRTSGIDHLLGRRAPLIAANEQLVRAGVDQLATSRRLTLLGRRLLLAVFRFADACLARASRLSAARRSAGRVDAVDGQAKGRQAFGGVWRLTYIHSQGRRIDRVVEPRELVPPLTSATAS